MQHPPRLIDHLPRVRRALSVRQIAVLRLVATGLSNKAVGRRLGITFETVGSHLTAIFDKLGVRTRTEATTRGIELGYVDEVHREPTADPVDDQEDDQ